MVSRTLRRGPLVLGNSVLFGVLGVVAAAYSAHLVLESPYGAQTTAGPAWLLSGLGVGALVGALLATGVIRFVHRRSR